MVLLLEASVTSMVSIEAILDGSTVNVLSLEQPAVLVTTTLYVPTWLIEISASSWSRVAPLNDHW